MTALKKRTDTVLLYQGDDLEQLLELKKALAVAERQQASGEARLGDGSAHVDEARAELESFIDVATARAVEVTLTALGRIKWRNLVKAHPPREGNADDADSGLNTETFYDELVPLSVTNVEGGLEPVQGSAAIAEFIDDLTDANFERLSHAAFLLNRVSSSVDPKAWIGSGPTPESDET